MTVTMSRSALLIELFLFFDCLTSLVLYKQQAQFTDQDNQQQQQLNERLNEVPSWHHEGIPSNRLSIIDRM
jgi:hypothetical protein